MAAFHRDSGQAMAIAGASMAIVTALLAVVASAGMFLIERRHLQNAADAAALAAAERQTEERASRSFRDAPVLAAATTLAALNDVDVGGDRELQMTYVDESGSSLGTGGEAPLFPEASVSVQVELGSELSTLVPGFLFPDPLRVRASARAGFTSLPFPDTVANPVPLGVPLVAFQAGPAFDLYDQTVALTYGIAEYRPFLDLANAANAGSGYQPGTDFGDPLSNLQYWSDGLHDSGRLSAGTTLALAGGGFEEAVLAGLLDNVRRQGLIDGSGAPYALLDVPLWDTYQPSDGTGPDTIAIAGFARFKLVQDEITTTSLRGHFVPHAVWNPGAGPPAGVQWGPGRVRLLR